MSAVSLFTVEQIRQIETAYTKALANTHPHPHDSLMLRAGQAVARLAQHLLDVQGQGGRILLLIGPGNNGGDAWVAAHALQQSWHRVTVLSMAADKDLAHAAQAARAAFLAAGGKVVSEWPSAETHDLIIDGLLGIGITRPITGDLATLIARANAGNVPILSIDIPSGLAADSGVALGTAILAHHTLTFIGAKPGLYTADGRDYCGQVSLDTLGIDVSFLNSAHTLLTADCVASMTPQRKHNWHKGQCGAVGVIGGASGMVGAALLAARAALHLGAGKVFLATLAEDALACDPLHPEIMLRKARDLLAQETLNALVLGPGMGMSDMAKNFVGAALKTDLTLVLDADALNLIAAGRALQNQLLRRTAPSLLTPHPGEAARLLQCSTAEVQAQRIKAACDLAKRFHAYVVLKGCGSVIAFPDGTWHINTTGNAGMASGGMGDALCGMLAALLAQGLAPQSALMLGVCLHGVGADRAVQQRCGPLGLNASEVIFSAREVLNDWASPAGDAREEH